MPEATGSTPVEVTLRDNVGGGAGRYAQTKIAHALEVAPAPVLHANVVLDWRHNPAPKTMECSRCGHRSIGWWIRGGPFHPKPFIRGRRSIRAWWF